MLPETLERLLSLVRDGATIVGDAPRCIATLSGGKKAQRRFDKAVKQLWGDAPVRKIGKGKIISGMPIDEALKRLNIEPDVKVMDGVAPLWLHRRVEGADWYFVCAPHGTDSSGITSRLSFRVNGDAEIWDPVTGEIADGTLERGTVAYQRSNNRTEMTVSLPRAGSCFVVFRPATGDKEVLAREVQNDKEVLATELQNNTKTIPIDKWTLSFPSGWGAPASMQLDELKAWKFLDVSTEARAFSGTAVYTATFDAGTTPGHRYLLNLGRVEMIASVAINGEHVRTVWATPYTVELKDVVKPGVNTLTVEVTSSWFNRLVYDASLPEMERKTWTINGPPKDAALRENGLIGPIVMRGL